MKRLLAVLAGFALVGCDPSPRPDPASTQAAPVAKAAENHDHGHGRVSDPHEEIAPLVLTLTPEHQEGNLLVLRADLDAPGALSLPVELMINLPPGSKLLDGVERDSVPVAKGRTSRTFRIERSDDSAPVRVIARVTHPKKAWGLYTEKTFPEVAKPVTFTPSPKPPMARPPNPMLRHAAKEAR